MGLDMFAYCTNHDVTDVDFEIPDDAVQFFYWRKHPNLHGWMESLYRDKGGTGLDFNCDTVRLRADDIDALAKTIKKEMLPSTAGFFFGQSDGSEKRNDVKFIAKARAVIKAGGAVFYSSWW